MRPSVWDFIHIRNALASFNLTLISPFFFVSAVDCDHQAISGRWMRTAETVPGHRWKPPHNLRRRDNHKRSGGRRRHHRSHPWWTRRDSHQIHRDVDRHPPSRSVHHLRRPHAWGADPVPGRRRHAALRQGLSGLGTDRLRHILEPNDARRSQLQRAPCRRHCQMQKSQNLRRIFRFVRLRPSHNRRRELYTSREERPHRRESSSSECFLSVQKQD